VEEEEEEEKEELDTDIIALFESMSNEEAAVLDETRESNPESVVGDELEEAAFLLEYELVEAPANNKVEKEANKEEDEDDTCSINAAARRNTAASLREELECVDTVVAGGVLFKVAGICIRLAHNIDNSLTANAARTVARVTIGISNPHSLACTASITVRVSLGLEKTAGVVVPVGGTDADGRGARHAAHRGLTTEVEIGNVVSHRARQVVVGRLGHVVKRRKIVLVALPLLLQHSLAVHRIVLRSYKKHCTAHNCTNSRKH